MCTVTCDDGLKIKTDPILLKEILSNLLNNAIQYTPEGGKIEVRITRTNDSIECRVQDNGLGIPKHQQDKIFEKFFRAENATIRDSNGTGLGLYLVKNLVDLLGATISFTSKENDGTTFTVVLPATFSEPSNGS